ncbi:MAG: hypothetical protein JSU68_08530 [Phycisphaerales bacterium]|nr:MAG: hypothetical protein JSU68_08530 [Phycisphaerales bacterium]
MKGGLMILAAAVMLFGGAVGTGCREQPAARESPQRPVEPAAPEVDEEPVTAEELSAEPEAPARQAEPPEPSDPFHLKFELAEQGQKHKGWVQVMKFFNEGDKAGVEATWEGGNRITVDSHNVQYLSLDLGQLPVNRGKSVILRLDGHGIQLSSRHWPVVEFERGQAGTWSLVRD